MPKIPKSCQNEHSSSKNFPILATQTDTNLAKKTHFHHRVAKSRQKISKFYPIFFIFVKNYPNCKQNNRCYQIFVLNIWKIGQLCHHLFLSKFFLTTQLFSYLININFWQHLLWRRIFSCDRHRFNVHKFVKIYLLLSKICH